MEFLLQKMKTAQEEQVQYWLGDDTQQFSLNALLGQPISLLFTGAIFCRECQKKISKKTIIEHLPTKMKSMICIRFNNNRAKNEINDLNK